MTFQNKKRILLREVMEDYLKDSPPKKDFIDTTNINFFSNSFPIKAQKKIDWEKKEMRGEEFYQKKFEFSKNSDIAKFIYVVLENKEKVKVDFLVKDQRVSVNIEANPLVRYKKIIKFVDSTYDSMKEKEHGESTNEE